MASSEFQAIVERMRATPPLDPKLSIEELRAGYNAAEWPMPDDTDLTPVDAGGVPGEWVVAAGANPAHRVLHFHGGGYVIGNIATHRDLAAAISHASGCAALIVDYRLAPENPFPAAVDDGLAAYRWMRANGPTGPAPARSTAIVGDSAGGGLTLATMIAARDAGDPLPSAAVLISPWTDLTLSGASMQTRKTADPRLTHEILEVMASHYLGGHDRRSPLASPMFADLRSLPPLLMQVGDAEIILDDTTRTAQSAREAGVAVTEEVWPEMFHVWHHMWATLPEAQEAVDRLGSFLKQHKPESA